MTTHAMGRQRCHSVRGSSLVEVMASCVILLVVAIGGGSFLFRARADEYTQRARRIAAESVNARLELVKAAPYDQVKPPAKNYSTYYLSRPGGVWTAAASNPGETVSVNGLSMPLVTTVTYIDVDQGKSYDDHTATYDAVRVSVKANYRAGSSANVTVETIRSP